uniref:Uncharacterized protein n=1 Tax=viral metagenome TaxID=1070528 RepID=A0A6M3LYE6_9ZZZZ
MNAVEIEITEDDFEEQLNELYPPAQICGITFDAGRILKELDPIAFRCYLHDSEQSKWECGKCGEQYEEEDEAEECCKD